MHTDFAEWYRAAGIKPNGDDLPRRWEAVTAFPMNAPEIGNAARLFYGLPEVDQGFPQRIRVALQKADPAVQMSGNDREIALIAGALLVETIVNVDFPLAFCAAFSAVCPAAKNLRRNPLVPAIPEIASNELAGWSSERTYGDAESKTGPDKNLPAKGADDLRSLCQAGDVAALSEPLARLYQAVLKIQKSPAEFQHQLALQAEETNMLWWLFGEHSRDTNMQFSEFTPAAACLIGGKELADLTQELPGPIAAVAFLDKVVRKSRKKFPALVTIEDAVNDTPREWRKKILERSGVDSIGNLAPIMEAVRASLRVEEGESWAAIYLHSAGIKADGKLMPADLADQFYQENLLLQAWNLSSSPA